MFSAMLLSMLEATLTPNVVIAPCAWTEYSSHIEVVGCKAKQRDALAAKLQKRYEALLSEAKEHDKSMQDIGSNALIFNEQYLRESQEQFTAYKNAECGRRMALADAGTAGADFHVYCEIELILQRLESLRSSEMYDENDIKE